MSTDRYAQIALGQRARQVRESQGLTQAEWRDLLATKCGIEVDQASLSRIENGRQGLPLGWMPCWASLGGVEPAWLAWGLDPLPGAAPPPAPTRAAGTGAARPRRRPRS